MQREDIDTETIPPHFEKGAWVEGHTLKVYMDDNAEDPRGVFDNFGHMICFHRRYNLGDKHGIDDGDFSGWDEIETHLIEEKEAAVILPLYLYDHSGITMNTTGFSCGWDSGQVGFIYVTEADILDNWNCKTITNELRGRAKEVMIAEVQEYDDFLTGNVYGFEIEDEKGEVVESCWGFYGDAAKEEIKKEFHMQYGTSMRSQPEAAEA